MRKLKKLSLTSLLVLTMAAQAAPPWNCQYAGRALGLAVFGLAVNIGMQNPIGFGLSAFGTYFAWMNWVRCQEANNQDPSRW